MLVLLRRSFSYVILGVFIWIYLNPRNFNPRNFNFLVGFSFKTIFAPPRPITTLVSKDVEFSCASFDLYEKFARWCPPTQTPTRKFKTGISIFSSQGMGSTLVSLRMIFKALQSELFRLKFHSLSSKIEKFPEFNLLILDFMEIFQKLENIKLLLSQLILRKFEKYFSQNVELPLSKPIETKIMNWHFYYVGFGTN